MKKRDIITIALIIITIILFVLLLYILFEIKKGLDTTVTVQKKEDVEQCEHDVCIVFSSKYEDGFAIWEVKEGWPFMLGISTSGFEEGEKVLIVCPHDNPDDTLLSKVSFFLEGSRVNRCTVHSAD